VFINFQNYKLLNFRIYFIIFSIFLINFNNLNDLYILIRKLEDNYKYLSCIKYKYKNKKLKQIFCLEILHYSKAKLQATMSIITGTPLCWTEEGQQIIEKKGLELQNWLDTELYKSKESYYMLSNECCKFPKIVSWWKTDYCQDRLREFISNRENQFVNGEKWNNGQFGSRWADITLVGVRVRIAFYSRQFDPKIIEDIVIKDNNDKIMPINYLVVGNVLEYNQEELFMTEAEIQEEAILQEQRNKEIIARDLEKRKVKADEAQTKLLADLEAEENKKSSPKKKKEKKIKEAKVAVNPHKKEIRISEGIWKPNPAWKKWEQENKRSASPP